MKNAPEVYEVSAYAEWVSFPAYVLIFCPDDLRKWAKTMAEADPTQSDVYRRDVPTDSSDIIRGR